MLRLPLTAIDAAASVAVRAESVRLMSGSDGAGFAYRLRSQVYERMRMLGQRLMSGLAAAGRRYGQPVHVSGAGPVFFLWFSESEPAGFADHVRADWARYRRFSELLLLNGVRTIPTAGRWYLSAAHREEDVDRTLEAAERAFAALR